MRHYAKRPIRRTLAAALGALALLLVLAVACDSDDGEDRPGVAVIGESGSVSASVSGSVSASVSGVAGAVSVSGPAASISSGVAVVATSPTEHYTPVSNVTPHADITLDLRDVAALLQAAKTDADVDWAAITQIYENGANSATSSGGFRTLAGYATSDSVQAEFPGGAGLDAAVRAGLTGMWAGRSIDDPTRRQLINKGLQAILYGKVLQELTAARNKMEQGNTDDASGAPHNVDEAWAFYVGAPGDESNYPYGISATADKREANFDVVGAVNVPLQQALAAALAASRTGDLATYDAAADEVRRHLNGVFYLATARYGLIPINDEDAGSRAEHLAEGWAFFQPIYPTVRAASSSAAAAIDAHFTADPSMPVSADAVNTFFDALNQPAVLQALGVTGDILVVSPLRSTYYAPVSNVVPHAALTLDMRDISALLAPARSGGTVDWAAITQIYENGANSATSSGGFRTFAGYATSDSVQAEFPGGATLDANVRAGLTGMWAGRSIDDPTRRQLINKGLQAIMYGKVLQELTAARNKIEQGSTDDASGAPHNVDEAWAFYVGAPNARGHRGYSISATARSREGNFGLRGTIAVPLEQALASTLAASRSGDLAAYDAAAAEVRSRLNSIFYLATLRYAKKASVDEETGPRSEHLAEGWAFFQPLHPAVRAASASAADTIEGLFTADPSGAVSAEAVQELYAALNEPAVLQALGIPANVRVTDPAQAN